MPNITRGNRPVGLMVYLASGGRANEHTEPHIVAGDQSITAWLGDDELDRAAAVRLGRELDQPRRVFGAEMPGGSVWHCSLSLRDREPHLDDERWSQIAHELVAGMGLVGAPGADDEGRAPCRWLAVRHGLSKAGNDHIHVVVSLVREDGTKANVFRDRPRVQKLCGELEQRHGLEVLESRLAERGTRGYQPAEQAIADRKERLEQGSERRSKQGDGPRPETARERLARIVRASAASSESEAEFVGQLQQEGVWIRARFATGRSDVVAGYSVALPSERGERAVFYGGGNLGRDLTLPRVRQGWLATPESATAAVAAWSAATSRQRSEPLARPTEAVGEDVWSKATEEMAALRQQLRSVPVEDRAAWAHVARDTAGVFAAWSLRVEPQPGPLAHAAHMLARSAQTRAHNAQPRPRQLVSVRGAARTLRVAASGGKGTVSDALMWRQVAATMKAVHDAHVAVGEANHAADISRMVRDQLHLVQERMPELADVSGGRAATELARTGQQPLRPGVTDPGAQTERPPAGPTPGVPKTREPNDHGPAGR